MPGSICISDKQKNGTHNNWVQYLGQTFTKKVFVGLGFFFFFFFFLPHLKVHGILVPPSWIKPTSPALEAQSLDYWSTREVPKGIYYLPENHI